MCRVTMGKVTRCDDGWNDSPPNGRKEGGREGGGLMQHYPYND